MIDRTLIEKLVTDIIADTDIFIVEIKITPGNVIEVVLDNDTSISIDDCIKVNRTICEKLGEDADFELSVYSAGLSEPLKLKRQYLKNIGKEVELVLKSGVKQRGTLSFADDDRIEITYVKNEKQPGAKRKTLTEYVDAIELKDIKSTKLYIKV